MNIYLKTAKKKVCCGSCTTPMQTSCASPHPQTLPSHFERQQRRRQPFPPCHQHRLRRQAQRRQPQGGYVLLHITDHSSITDKDSIQVEFIRFDYDIEKAAKAVEDSRLPTPMPNPYGKASNPKHPTYK